MTAAQDFDRLARVERLARRMDRAFRLPFTRIRLGWDAILGLVPGIGDTLALLPAVWILKEAREMGAPNPLLAQMAGNMGVDWLIGLVPFLGDIFDVGFRANLRNTALLRRWLEQQHGKPELRPEVSRV
ncbi:DUF4112 domain-containing protein [Salipiger marinus]|uniref:DUF4112 domain-containing protein n=1 Tax=Salipiger marinus TaxID=555512 RepID=UPI0040591FEE